VSQVDFRKVPNEARLWVFAATEPLSEEQRERLLQHVDEFIAGWLAHGRPVVGARELRYDRFLLVAADEAATGVSGCSIDSLFRSLKQLERELGITLLDSSHVWYRAPDGDVRAVTRGEFRQLAGAGEVDAGTTVFDNTVRSVGAVRSGRWETAAAESWHARLIEAASADAGR
jgi:hypothetical protein